MVPDPDAAYRALLARDARFDGRLYVGVTSTGVYCRPVCRVRTPRREHCRFFATRAQAEAAAFRPCLKCRPEIAPGLAPIDAGRTLADDAARLLGLAVEAGERLALPALAARLGITERHLRRIFRAAHGVAPRDYVATLRLLLAKRLLADTTLAITEIAFASGFESLRRFNAAFALRYRLSPTQLRRGSASAADTEACAASLRLAYRPPYDAATIVGFLAARALPGVEMVDRDRLALRRTVGWTHRGRRVAGWFEARLVPARCELHLDASPGLAPALGALLERVRHAFDLDADPALIDPVLERLPVAPRPGLRLPGCVDGFELGVRVILGQQVGVAAARTLAGRLVQRFGTPIATPHAGLTHLFPAPETIAAAAPAEIGTLGIVRQRVRALQALAAAVADGRIELRRGAPLAPTLAALRSLPGVGEWTAQLVAMRALAWPDAWPAGDLGVLAALGTRDPKAAQALAEDWRPWRAYAVIGLWHHLEHSR